MGLAGAGRPDEVDDLGAVDELQFGERHDAVPVERGLEGEVEAGEGLDRREPGHLERHFDAAVLAQGQLLGEQGVDGLDGADLAALDAAHDDVEDFERARHLQADEVALDALDDGGARSSCASAACETAADGVVEVERAATTRSPARSGSSGSIALAAAARADGLAMRRIEPLLATSFQRRDGSATSAPSSKMRISSARTWTSRTRRRVVSGTL